MTREPIHCRHCGRLTSRRKYCEACAPLIKKAERKARDKRYRERHGNKTVKQWQKEHPDEVRLMKRRWYQNHPEYAEKNREKTRRYRLRHPERVKKQNRRAYKKRKLMEMKRNYMHGVRMPSPSEGDTRSFCKSCEREIPYHGHGTPRKYCDSCFPQTQALRIFHQQQRFKQKNPNHFKEWWRNTKEHTVASVCVVCGCLIIYKGKGMIPLFCEPCGFRRNVLKGRKRDRLRNIPSDSVGFINHERERLGLNRPKKWNKKEILGLYRYYENRHPPPMAVDDE